MIGKQNYKITSGMILNVFEREVSDTEPECFAWLISYLSLKTAWRFTFLEFKVPN